MLASACASRGWAVLWRFEGKPQEASPKLLRCAQRLLEEILIFVIPGKQARLQGGFCWEPLEVHHPFLMEQAWCHLAIHGWSYTSSEPPGEQKCKICCVTSKAQKSVGTNWFLLVEIRPWLYLNIDWDTYLEISFSQSWVATSLIEHQEGLEKNSFTLSLPIPHWEEQYKGEKEVLIKENRCHEFD